uniref:Uncharacterized protein n=1 Tax=Amphimedon queenslandica TaxID=400682 RepID=A0A1X7VUQ1_AMPQE
METFQTVQSKAEVISDEATSTANYNGIKSHRNRTADYFTDLMKYNDKKIAKHSQFCFFALNTELRWRANETR